MSVEPAMIKVGGLCGGSEDHWQRTSVLDIFTDSPIVLYVSWWSAGLLVCVSHQHTGAGIS